MSGLPKKATDEQLARSYKDLASVKKVAAVFGMCSQSVHERIVRLGLSNKVRKLSAAEADRLERDYEAYANAGKLDDLAREMGRTKQYIARHARVLELTNQTRKRIYNSGVAGIRMVEWHKNNPHPRGMAGKSHSEKTKNTISQHSFNRWHGMSNSERVKFQSSAKRSWKADWRAIGGKRSYYRSAWEANYARYLEWLKLRGEIIAWEHEPKTFWFLSIKRGIRSYLPDFSVTERDNSVVYHEIKGWMDAGSKTKLRRMTKYHPHVPLILVDAKAYKSIAKLMGRMIKDWE